MTSGVTAFVFAGGGSIGASEVGMLQALVERDVAPSFVVGASAGAINALYFASDPTIAGVARLAALWCDLRRDDVFPVTRLRSALALIGRSASLLDPAALRRDRDHS